MKKLLSVALTLILLFAFVSCSKIEHGNTENCTVTIGKSDSFTEAEIRKAVDAVKTKFRNEYGGCTLVSITYNEAESHIDAGLNNGYKAEDIIYLVSDFITGDKIEPTGFETNMEYSDWSWTVVRTGSGKWSVISWGFDGV